MMTTIVLAAFIMKLGGKSECSGMVDVVVEKNCIPVYCTI